MCGSASHRPASSVCLHIAVNHDRLCLCSSGENLHQTRVQLSIQQLLRAIGGVWEAQRSWERESECRTLSSEVLNPRILMHPSNCHLPLPPPLHIPFYMHKLLHSGGVAGDYLTRITGNNWTHWGRLYPSVWYIKIHLKQLLMKYDSPSCHTVFTIDALHTGLSPTQALSSYCVLKDAPCN